jgi:hypothetical protein
VGQIKENTEAHIMILQPSYIIDSLEESLMPLKDNEEGLVFIINSMTRKKILKEPAQEEISYIQESLGDKFKIFGIYSDYAFFPDKETRQIQLTAGNLIALNIR